jgi:hypothetical protein
LWPGGLEQLQTEADEILQTTIQQVENSRLDQAAVQAFSLALEQTRGAIYRPARCACRTQ